MPKLKPVVDKIDDVDEKFRELYTERNGKWEFTGVEGVKTQADVDRQLAANQKVRTDLQKAQADLKTANDKLAIWKADDGADLDPEDVKSRLEKLATYEAGNSVPELAKNFEATVQTRLNSLLAEKVKAETTKLQRQITDLQNKLGESTKLNENYAVQANERTVHDAVRGACTTAKVLPEAVPDILLVAGRELKLVDGKPLTDDGRDVSAWLEDRKAKTPFYWPAAQGTGARGSGEPGAGGVAAKDNPFSRQGWNMTKGGQLLQTNPAMAAKLAEAAGVPKDADGKLMFHVMPPAEQK